MLHAQVGVAYVGYCLEAFITVEVQQQAKLSFSLL